MSGEMINICIVHFNTPKLTECLIRSINKYTPNCHIYIFDNSDKNPFTYKQNNITLFDNTKGQIINFNEELKKYPHCHLSSGRLNAHGSFKHTISIEKCMELIDDNFILLDSDILLTKDIASIADEKFIYVAENVIQPKSVIIRVLPFICFINVKMCKENGIHYFDDNYMHGLRKTTKSDMYDTGAGFYINTQNFPHKEIKFNDYVIHYKGGSWEDAHNKRYNITLSSEEWMAINRKYWDVNYSSMTKGVIYTCITGDYDTLNDKQAINPNFDYICFTDNPNLTSKTWQIRKMPKETEGLSNVKKQRYVKINAHKVLSEYKLSIWVDGSVNVLKNLDTFISDVCNNNYNIFIPQHPSRTCIYDEFNACAKLKKDSIENMKPQMDRYKAEGFPAKYGLVQSNIIVRRHNEPDCIRLMECWWNELKNGSHRDQLSFNYALWKNKDAKFLAIDKKTCNSTYFFWNKFHKKKVILNDKKPSRVAPITNKINYSSSKKEKTAKLRTFLGSI